MTPCVYATQGPIWLDAASACDPSLRICFRSNKRWSTAAKLLERCGPLPLLFRAQKDSAQEMACQFVAELVEVRFRNQFASDAVRRSWLDENLWLQREAIQALERSERFPTWESQFEAWEIDNFMKADTWYMVRNLRRIKPLPLPHLRKLDGDHPLSANYKYGYALCHYPTSEVEFVESSAVAPSIAQAN